MNKSELKPGMCVALKNAQYYVVSCRESGLYLFGTDGESRLSLDWWNESFNYRGIIKPLYQPNGHDIVKVYKDFTLKELLWERDEVILSDEEITILKSLNSCYEWIARDADRWKVNELYLYVDEPNIDPDGIFITNHWRSGIGLLFLGYFESIKPGKKYLIADLIGGNNRE